MGRGKRTVGILGAGNIVESLHLPVLRTIDELRVVWICDRDETRAVQMARKFSIPAHRATLDSCEEVDMVLVAIPVGYRRPCMEQIARRGWHALCEKPFAPSLCDHDHFVNLAERASVQVAVGLMRRTYASTRAAADLIRSRAFGPVEEVFAGEGGPLRGTGRDSSWYQCDREAAGGGVLIETGSHLIDQVCAVLSTERARLREYESDAPAREVEGHVKLQADLALAKGDEVPARFVLSRTQTVPNGIWVRCRNATVGFGVGPAASVHIQARDGKTLGTLARESGAVNSYQAFRLEWLEFLRQVETGMPGELDAGRSRLTLALIEACYTAASPSMEAVTP